MRSTQIEHVLASLSAEYHGLVLHEQARALGVSEAALQRRRTSGLLVPVDDGLSRLAAVPPSAAQLALAACIVSGGVRSHRSAGRAWRLDGTPGGPLEVLVPRWERPRRRPWFVTHEARDLEPGDVTTLDGVPTTAVVRTLLDLAAVVHRHRADQVIEDALRRDLCTVADLANRFVQVARRGRPGTTVMRELLGTRLGSYVPTGSEFERRMVERIRALALPEPVRQHPVELDETTVYLDLAWPERLLAIECDGLFHHGHNQQLPWDADRQNQLVLRGWLVLRFTWQQCATDGLDVDRQITSAYRLRAPRRSA